MSVVADTGGIYAIYDADDEFHESVTAALLGEPGDIIVPAAILSEIDYLLKAKLGVDAELDFLAALCGGVYRLEPTTLPDLERAQGLIASYRDLKLGVADAVVIATAERLGTKRVLTVDQRHFRVVRALIGPLTLVPSDVS